MEIVSVKNIEREPGFIYYRRTYHSVLEIVINTQTVEATIKFTIEMDPLGRKNIELDIESDIDYPLLPLRKAIKEYITKIDSEGVLPC